ncbi:MAG: methyltransferase, TIGR04325 family [Candidatus Berkiella sp.]
MILDELLPPITKKIAKKIMGKNNVYQNFEQANLAVKKFNGYDDIELIEAIFKKAVNFIDALKTATSVTLDAHHLFLLSVISMLDKNNLKILDFGGAFGTHYYIAKKFLKHIHFDWTVVELPEVIKLGKPLQNEELSFFDLQGDFSQPLGDFDLVLTSATLQHMPSPLKTLSFLTLQNAPYIALMRLGITPEREDLWTLHKAHFRDCGPGKPLSACPDKVAAFTFCMMSTQNVDEALKQYELIISNTDASGTISVPGKIVQGYNRLYRRKANKEI